ncbi:hypothetical protein BC936DRAFT_148959 [Jimgerdemannia flammicorona]|uniref:Uncharacterized protein n=1 Tax=Jimgerdemannia flammicorona TaxID=994334 RepID=A0A433D1X6_9FUNG|nr:hypothetical protein BC936DRAFT_148959 [Jimgerdemannia flammicorona]
MHSLPPPRPPTYAPPPPRPLTHTPPPPRPLTHTPPPPRPLTHTPPPPRLLTHTPPPPRPNPPVSPSHGHAVPLLRRPSPETMRGVTSAADRAPAAADPGFSRRCVPSHPFPFPFPFPFLFP